MNQTTVSNVQNSRGKIRAAILEQVSKLKIATIDSLVEMSEREVKFKSLGGKHYSLKSYIPTATTRLVSVGLLEWRKTKSDKSYLALTERGRAQMLSDQLAFRQVRRQSNKKWDNKWRIIIFDIKEQKRFWRARLRDELKKLGFVKLQQSVWLSPYPCEDLMELLKTELRVGKEAIYLTVDRFDGDIWLRKHFSLV